MGPTAVTVAIGLRLGARRPATWLAFAATIACGAALVAAWGAATVPVAVVCGGLVAVAAVGVTPWSRPGIALPTCVRWSPLLWPLAGAAVVAGAAGGCGRTIAGIIATAAVVTQAFRSLIGRIGSTWQATPDRGEESGAPAAASEGRWQAGTARGLLAGVAMATTLLAMAVCYFLDADRAGWYALVASFWFVVLILPISPGAEDEAARERLLRSSAGPPAGVSAAPLPGTLPFAVRALGAHAALLAWPACVAALLWRGGSGRGDGPLVAIAVLAALMTSAASALVAARLCGAGGDTTRAVVACGCALASAALLPQLPVPPSLPGQCGPRAVIDFRVGVEGLRASCETTHVTQSP